jgi:5'-3' exonuclease
MQYLIDASVYVFRAYYSMPDDMVDADGNPVNALYGFCRFLGDFMEQVNPEYVAVLFDESLSSSFRTEIYPEYKANRDPAPEELKRQFMQCRRYTRALGVMELASPHYEADDLIGTLVEHGRKTSPSCCRRKTFSGISPAKASWATKKFRRYSAFGRSR